MLINNSEVNKLDANYIDASQLAPDQPKEVAILGAAVQGKGAEAAQQL